MEENKESLLTDYPNVIQYECTKKIIEQMEKEICRIIIGKNKGTGFFCKIPFPNQNNMLPVFITNNHIINKDLLNKKDTKITLYIKEEENEKELILNKRMKYTNEEYDITIIEIKEEDNINNYLELDDIIINDVLYNKNKNIEYINETIYIIQYPENKLSVSYGILDKIYEDKKYNFNHKCNTKEGSSGSPILNLNNKLIGVHKVGTQKYKKGAFLNYAIKEFIRLNNNNNINNNNKNEITLNEIKDKNNSNIKEIKNDKLDLGCFFLGDKGLNDLKINKMNELKELKELDLSVNNISNIKILTKIEFVNLEILNLSFNKISDINILEKANLKQLKELYLNYNQIIDIKVLEKVKFNKIKIINLSHNLISDITILEKVNFKELKELNLYYNKISDIKVFEKVNFEKLEALYLSYNQITDTYLLKDVKFEKLKTLDLSMQITNNNPALKIPTKNKRDDNK